MTEPTFDPAQALKIDLSRGQLTLHGSSGRFLVPTEGLIDLLAASSTEAIAAFGAGIGMEIGRRVADRLGTRIDQASVELFLEHLGGELALTGLGSLSVERWGKALVLCLESIKVQGSQHAACLERVLAALIEAALQRSLSRDVSAMLLAHDDSTWRFLVAGRHARPQVERWLASGLSYGDVLTRLHRADSLDSGTTRGKS
ncbi:MAG TPA: hypothetical protein VKP30_16000 [Polyangiaceae bacterium]|nr:hypothetical protein [Polyangiaceae bacterium]